MRNAAGDLDILDAAPDLRLGFAERLAIFHGDEPGELVDVFFEQLLELEEVLDAFAGRSAAPGGERGQRGLDGGIDLRGARERRAGHDLCRRRVHDFHEYSVAAERRQAPY